MSAGYIYIIHQVINIHFFFADAYHSVEFEAGGPFLAFEHPNFNLTCFLMRRMFVDQVIRFIFQSILIDNNLFSNYTVGWHYCCNSAAIISTIFANLPLWLPLFLQLLSPLLFPLCHICCRCYYHQCCYYYWKFHYSSTASSRIRFMIVYMVLAALWASHFKFKFLTFIWLFRSDFSGLTFWHLLLIYFPCSLLFAWLL